MKSPRRRRSALLPFVFLLVTAPAVVARAADEVHWTVTGQRSVTFDWRGSGLENTLRYGPAAGQYTNTVTAVNPSSPNVPFSSAGILLHQVLISPGRLAAAGAACARFRAG